MYESIINKTLEDAHANFQQVAQRSQDKEVARTRQHRKRARTVSESGSSDSDSDSLCALSEVKAAQDKAQVWKARAMEYKEERDYLRDRVISLEKCLESKIFQLEGTLPQQRFQGFSSSKGFIFYYSF
ncbi:uncharacterized protein LOC142588672 [Dermacentor variabilis]|uniref:uncharacterized protein LOC142588672 n=1 Tax=Dermacentor variabilis TaxID=34621 RepID=UPI003F5C4247